MIPHDYYDGLAHPELHNRGEGRPYVDPDYHAHAHHDQLPLLSTVGRGPRGEGVQVGTATETDDNVSFTLVSTLTGEKLWESPNMAPPRLSVSAPDWSSVAAGTPLPVTFTVRRGGRTETQVLYMPPGQPGATLHVATGVYDRTADDVYVMVARNVREDVASGASLRVGDTVAFQYADEGHVGPDGISGVAFGYVSYLPAEDVQDDSQLTVVAKIYVPCGKGEDGDFEDLTEDQVAELTSMVSEGLPYISTALVDEIWNDALQPV